MSLVITHYGHLFKTIIVINNTFPPSASTNKCFFWTGFEGFKKNCYSCVIVYSFMLKTLQTWKWFSNRDFYILRNSNLEKRQKQIKTLCNEELSIMILPKYPRCFEGRVKVPGRAARTYMHTALPWRPLDIGILHLQKGGIRHRN